MTTELNIYSFIVCFLLAIYQSTPIIQKPHVHIEDLCLHNLALYDFRYPPGYFVQETTFDFFNYAGIHRPVKLYTTPVVYLSDITITTSHSDQEGVVKFASTVSSSHSVNVSMNYELVDKAGNVVAAVVGPGLFEGTLNVKNPMLWWPVGMSDQPAYLYSLKVWLMNTVYGYYFGIYIP